MFNGKANPSSVSDEWQALYLIRGKLRQSHCEPPVFPKRSVFSGGGVDQCSDGSSGRSSGESKLAIDQRVSCVRGHIEADIDPLGRKSIKIIQN